MTTMRSLISWRCFTVTLSLRLCRRMSSFDVFPASSSTDGSLSCEARVLMVM